MSERIRSTQGQKKIKDEKDLLSKTIQSMENQLAAKMLLCQKLEEKERILIEQRGTLEHEIRIREQHNESLKKKACEFSQLSTDLKLRLERLDVQFNELRENVIKKASTHEADANKIKRLEEEKSSMKRKLDRAKKMEKLENVDQVIQEENRILRVKWLYLRTCVPWTFMRPINKKLNFSWCCKVEVWFQNISSCSGPTPTGSGTVPYPIHRNF
ncbi:unnamed protein product [Meloidogyne enterolobii]|uniref:Uncharacterized protein n=1 Tax=Meloidogyne enterolobii TaxID=390850 RepID=A0ACB0XXB7_MELEN